MERRAKIQPFPDVSSEVAAAAAVEAGVALDSSSFHPTCTIRQAFPFLLLLDFPSSSSSSSSSLLKLDVPSLSSRLVLHPSVQPLDLLMGMGRTEGGEGGMEGGVEDLVG